MRKIFVWLVLVVIVVAGLSQHCVAATMITTFDEAKKIMGPHFIGFTDEVDWLQCSAAALAGVPFSATMLESCRANFVLVYNSGLSIQDMIYRYPALFFDLPEGRWWNNLDFATKRAAPGWQLIGVRPADKSIGRIYQANLLEAGEYIPSAQTLVYLCLIQDLFGKTLLAPGWFLRTSDVLSDNGSNWNAVQVWSGGGLSDRYLDPCLNRLTLQSRIVGLAVGKRPDLIQ